MTGVSDVCSSDLTVAAVVFEDVHVTFLFEALDGLTVAVNVTVSPGFIV